MLSHEPTTVPSRHPRVVVIDDHPLFAEALELALTRAGYDVRLAEIPDSPARTAALVSQGTRGCPGVVLLDLDLGHFGDGARLIPGLTRAGAAVVVLATESDRTRWGECLARGARTVISKTAPLDDVLTVLRRLSTGLPVIEPDEREALVARWQGSQVRDHQHQHSLERLTVREAEVLGDLTLGRTVREIASRSVVSEATVRTQVKSILGKLGVSSQLAAVGLAWQVGWRAPVDDLSPALARR